MKPLIKKPSKFKEKLKSFFHVDIEKDLQEEEPTKVFEKIPLINLTRNKIFLGIFLFLVIVNILVGFGIDFLYIRAILGFLFLVTVPGLLIMLCFKIRTVKFWEFLVYTIGLSIAFIMFAGLIVNWTLPALNITDKPLSLYPILICFDILLIALGIVGWKRNKDFPPFQFTVPKLDALNNIFFIIPMAFPILSILGAFLLNNHGSNILTMILLGSIAVYVLLLVIFRKKMNENVWPWAILMISISILLSYSLRSWYVLGFDINQEYYVFQLTANPSLWKMSYLFDSYNSCLSLNILPTVIYSLTGINSELIFRLLFQVMFGFMLIILYLLVWKIGANKIISFLATAFFIFQTWFGLQMSWLTRQEIAFIFFGLILLVLFTKQFNPLFKKILFLIFGASMIVSHYSTAYIALAIFTLTYILTFFYRKYENKQIKKGKLPPSQKSEFYLTGVLILLLLLFGFLWYNQLTPTGGGLINFADRSISNLRNMFNEDVFNFNLQQAFFTSDSSRNVNARDFIQNITQDYHVSLPNINYYGLGIYQKYSPQISYPKSIPPLDFINLTSSLYKIFSWLKIIINYLFILLGVLLLYFYKRNRFLFILCVVSLILLGVIIFLPSASINYNLTRLYMQLLVILTVTGVLGGLMLLKKTKINLEILTILFVIYFLFSTGFIFQITGGPASINLNNFGTSYEEYYIHKTEILSSNYLILNMNNHYLLYADYVAKLRIIPLKFKNKILMDLFPSTISTDSYVYASETNYLNYRTYTALKKGDLSISLTFPTEFLNENKNRIYNNGGSEIFK